MSTKFTEQEDTEESLNEESDNVHLDKEKCIEENDEVAMGSKKQLEDSDQKSQEKIEELQKGLADIKVQETSKT